MSENGQDPGSPGPPDQPKAQAGQPPETPKADCPDAPEAPKADSPNAPEAPAAPDRTPPDTPEIPIITVPERPDAPTDAPPNAPTDAPPPEETSTPPDAPTDAPPDAPPPEETSTPPDAPTDAPPDAPPPEMPEAPDHLPPEMPETPHDGSLGEERSWNVYMPKSRWPLFRRLVSVSVCIQTSKGNTGSGVVLASNGLILTAWHVLRRGGRPYVHRFRLVKKTRQLLINKTGDRADLVYKDERADIALIRMRNPPKTLRAAVLGDSDLKPGAALFRVGADEATPLSAGYLIKHGKCQRLDQLEIALPAAPGSSGGPVFNLDGEVVGIALRALYNKIEPSCCEAIPINLVRQRLYWRRLVKDALPEDFEW